MQTNTHLSNNLEMGAVVLRVNNLEATRKFYIELVGLDVLRETSSTVVLGSNGREVVIIKHTPELTPAPRGSAGLYHLAIVFASRGTLVHSIQKILTQDPTLFIGTADHLVSEAFYFTDPEGNGVELYFDKDPKTWLWRGDQIVMDSIFIDPHEYINTHQSSRSHSNKKLGHVHLKVGEIETARKFYHHTLGFAVTASMPTALFMSEGSYHHHVGMNVWESYGAGKRQKSLGLEQFTVYLPTTSELNNLTKRLEGNQVTFTSVADTIILNDPWENTIEFKVLPEVF